MKDVSTHRTVADSLIDTCTFKVSNVQRARVDGHEETQHNAEREEKVKTAQYLLGELRALIAGEGELNRSCVCSLSVYCTFFQHRLSPH